MCASPTSGEARWELKPARCVRCFGFPHGALSLERRFSLRGPEVWGKVRGLCVAKGGRGMSQVFNFDFFFYHHHDGGSWASNYSGSRGGPIQCCAVRMSTWLMNGLYILQNSVTLSVYYKLFGKNNGDNSKALILLDFWKYKVMVTMIKYSCIGL